MTSPTEVRRIYKCPEPGCDKEFYRSEHLSRHKLNHNPKVIYKCHYENCLKTFVRNDLWRRHLKRHDVRNNKIKNNDLRNVRKLGGERTYKKDVDEFFMVGDNIEDLKKRNIGISEFNKPKDDQLKKLNPKLSPLWSSTSTISTPNLEMSYPQIPRPEQALVSTNPAEWMVKQEPVPVAQEAINFPTQPKEEFESLFFPSTNNFNIESLFSLGDNETNSDLQISPNSLLLNMFNDPTLFPLNGSNIYTQYKSKLIKIDDLMYTDMIKLIPLLAKNIDFTISNIEDLLENYWRFFHPTIPFLHKPSFSTVELPILLLLLMIMIGTRYVNCSYYNKRESKLESKSDKFSLALDLGITIADPLRWLIFSSREFTPPSRLWVFQSLVMLEYFEKSCSTRVLHERAHLHHGTIIQLLRRSPSLGGNPIKLDIKNTSELTNHDIWKRWVNIESMKRITFAVFYLDVIDAIRYGHQVMIFAYQIQLPMPCDDDLWENMKVNNDENGTVVPKQPLFLDTLKLMLNDKEVNTTNFGKEILFAGLLSIMFQLQQREMQISYGLEKFDQPQNQFNKGWKDAISLLLSIWKTDVAGSCCNTLISHPHNSEDVVWDQQRNSPTSTVSVYSTSDELDDTNIVVPQYSNRDTTCKHTYFHIANLYMRIPHYDFIVMAGAPYWMNVRPSRQDRILIRMRMECFFKSKDARFCVIQCYMLLWETFLKPQDDPVDPNGRLTYTTVTDAFNRSAMIGMCLIFLWDYNFLRDGVENTVLKYDPLKSLDEIREQEDGYEYLLRIRNTLCSLCDMKFLQTHYTFQKGVENHQLMLRYADLLEQIKSKQLLLGLLKLVAPIFIQSENELTRETGRLMKHCARRSCGSEVEVCEDMYVKHSI